MAMTRKQQRGALIGAGLGALGLAAGLVLYALSDTITFFYTPTDVVEKGVQPGTRFRLGGLVADGSIVRGQGKTVSFKVTDTAGTLPVTYVGILPDLFREGQGVIAEGMLDTSGSFKADTVLAKHDENYMPREVSDALKERGVWKQNDEAAKEGTQ
jgi:cytochrome c-type biogenesis protein CcmE